MILLELASAFSTPAETKAKCLANQIFDSTLQLMNYILSKIQKKKKKKCLKILMV